MSMQVTPGFGTTVATEIKGNAHHQRVIAHEDLVRSRVIPAVSATAYMDSQVVGGEMIFTGITRFAGDTSRLEAVQLVLTGNSTPADLDLILYPDALNVTPANRSQLSILESEAHSIVGIIRVRAEDFVSVGQHYVAVVRPLVPTILQAGAGASAYRGVLVARGELVAEKVDSLSVTLVARRS